MKILLDVSHNRYYTAELSTLFFSSEVLKAAELEQNIRIIVENLLKHPEALSLVRKVLSAGSVTVKWCPHAALRSTAEWYPQSRTISISTSKNDDPYMLLDCFIYEMCNADNAALALTTKIDIEKMDAESYAMCLETAEHQSSCRTAALVMDGVSQYAWPRSSGVQRAIKSLTDYLKSVREPDLGYHGFSHFDNYVYLHHRLLISCLSFKIRTLESRLNDNNVFLKQWLDRIDPIYKQSIETYKNRIAVLGFRELELKKVTEDSSEILISVVKEREDLNRELIALETRADDVTYKELMDEKQKYELELSSARKELSRVEALKAQMEEARSKEKHRLDQEKNQFDIKLAFMDQQIRRNKKFVDEIVPAYRRLCEMQNKIKWYSQKLIDDYVAIGEEFQEKVKVFSSKNVGIDDATIQQLTDINARYEKVVLEAQAEEAQVTRGRQGCLSNFLSCSRRAFEAVATEYTTAASANRERRKHRVDFIF